MDTQPTKIYLVRHGEAITNAFPEKSPEFHTQWGELESPLTDNGRKQAEKRAKELQDIHFDAIFSSDLTRAIQTAEIIAGEKTIAIQTSKLIREKKAWSHINKLIHLGRSKESINEEITTALEKLTEQEKTRYKFHKSMESDDEAARRLLTFLVEISTSYPGKTLLVVNHGNNIRALLTFLEFAEFDELPSESIENTAYIILKSHKNGFTIEETYGITKQKNTKRTI